MSNDNLPDYIRFFLEPGQLPGNKGQVKLVQTHISFVLIADEFVYKFKKPVDFGFLNFTSLDKRRHYCGEELRLNRRLCPDIYLETFAVSKESDGFSMADKGEVVEYGLKMRRMPLERMMADVIAAGQVDKASIDGIIAKLVPFYANAASDSTIQQFGKADAVAVNVLENFEQTEGFVDGGALSAKQFETISNYATTFLKQDDLFNQRCGQVKDCHGDLYSANICLADDIYIFDCIEFNERFRYCDVASDVAFLAMDLDFQGLPELSSYFINRFIEASGDGALKTMLNFYKCYRAYVRGKIGLFTAHAPEVDEQTKSQSLQMAGRYFELAYSYAVS